MVISPLPAHDRGALAEEPAVLRAELLGDELVTGIGRLRAGAVASETAPSTDP